MASVTSHDLEAVVFAGMVFPEDREVSEATAELILQWTFTAEQHARIAVLSEKAQAGTLSVDEQREIDAYLLVDNLVSIVQAKARRTRHDH